MAKKKDKKSKKSEGKPEKKLSKAEAFKARMEAMRKGKGKKGKKGTKSKKKKFLFPAPDGFKPFTAHIICSTGKDGLLQKMDVVRFKGRPDTDNVKSVKLSETDPLLLAQIALRLGATAFVTNVKKRLPSKSNFRLEVRVRKSKDNDLGFSVKEIKMISNEGKKKTLSKKDPTYRRLRKCARIMPGAFAHMEHPEFPKIKKVKEEEETAPKKKSKKKK